MAKSTKITKLHNRSKKYSANAALIAKATEKAKNGILSVSDAVDTLSKLELPNFKDGCTVEIHFKLNINPTKSDQLIRSNVTLPHGTGKKVIVAAFVNPENVAKAKAAGADIIGSEDLVEEIRLAGKVNFDKAVAEPEMMKKLPAIARILGTAGVMPNPKTGTVSDDIESMVKAIKAGKVDFRNDKSGNLHFGVGKFSPMFDNTKLVDNIEKAIDAVEKSKPDVIKKKFVQSIHLCLAMSPSIRLA